MIGRAGRPGFDTEGRAVVMVESSKKNFYKVRTAKVPETVVSSFLSLTDINLPRNSFTILSIAFSVLGLI